MKTTNLVKNALIDILGIPEKELSTTEKILDTFEKIDFDDQVQIARRCANLKQTKNINL